MKRITISFLIAIYSIAVFAQSVFMHEAQDDAGDSEPFSILGILTLLIIIGVIWLISTAIKTSKKHNDFVKDKKEREEITQRDKTIHDGGFICPACGKHIMDNEYDIIIESYELNSYKVKYCNHCAELRENYKDNLRQYELSNKEPELPNWLVTMGLLITIGMGIYALVRNCLEGEVFIGIVALITVPMVVGAIVGCVFWIVQKCMAPVKPVEPFCKPSLSHVQDCNAIKQ